MLDAERINLPKNTVEDNRDAILKRQLEDVDWPIDYGNVRIQLRDKRVCLVWIERTLKFD